MTGRTVAKILVVDDEPYLRQLLADALSDSDIEVAVAASGQEAVDLAKGGKVDLVVADLLLGDCNGAEAVGRIRAESGSEIPALVITGQRDPGALSEASRIRPIELMTKPLDIDRLRRAVRAELERQADYRKVSKRNERLTMAVKRSRRQRLKARSQLRAASDNLSSAYRELNGRIAGQQMLIDYQHELISARNDDDVFRSLFRLFVRATGSVFGVALVCNAEAELQVVGRFGVPTPDGSTFCKAIAQPLMDAALVNPRCFTVDAGDEREMFPEGIRKYLVGVTALVVPLIPAAGELIGLVVLYRKAEQPFTEADIVLAELIAPATSKAIVRND